MPFSSGNIGEKGGVNASLTIGGQRFTPVEYLYDDLFYSLGSVTVASAFYDFFGDALPGELVPTANNSGTVAANGGAGGTARFTTGTTSTNHATLALGTHWLVSNGFTLFTARVASITAIATRTIEIGLADATTETNGLVFSAHGTTTTAVADNAAIFAYDTGATPTLVTWGLFSVNATVAATRQVTTVAPVAGTYQRFDIAINSSGDAFYYINRALVGTQTAAVATTALLTPWIGVTTLAASAAIIDADNFGIVGDR